MRQSSCKNITSRKQTDNEFINRILRESLVRYLCLDYALVELVKPNTICNPAC